MQTTGSKLHQIFSRLRSPRAAVDLYGERRCQSPDPPATAEARQKGPLSATAICNPAGGKIPWISWRGARRWKMLCPREMESGADSYINLILRQVSFPTLTAYFLVQTDERCFILLWQRGWWVGGGVVADRVPPPTARRRFDVQRGFFADWITRLSNKERVCDLKTSVEEKLDCKGDERDRGINDSVECK